MYSFHQAILANQILTDGGVSPYRFRLHFVQSSGVSCTNIRRIFESDVFLKEKLYKTAQKIKNVYNFEGDTSCPKTHAGRGPGLMTFLKLNKCKKNSETADVSRKMRNFAAYIAF